MEQLGNAAIPLPKQPYDGRMEPTHCNMQRLALQLDLERAARARAWGAAARLAEEAVTILQLAVAIEEVLTYEAFEQMDHIELATALLAHVRSHRE